MSKYEIKCWRLENAPGGIGADRRVRLAETPFDILISDSGIARPVTPNAKLVEAAFEIGSDFGAGSKIVPTGLLHGQTTDDNPIIFGHIKSENGAVSENLAFSAGPNSENEFLTATVPTPLNGGQFAFSRGTLIETPHGALPVEQLENGDEVMTRTGDIQLITGMSRQRFSGLELALFPHLAPVRIKAGALKGGRPGQDLIVAQDHGLMVDDWRAEYLFGEDEILVPAQTLLNDRTVTIESSPSGVEYFDICVEDGGLVCANGLWAASGTPKGDVAPMPIPLVAQLDVPANDPIRISPLVA